MYFGFTHCPDICPLELVKMGKALDMVDNMADVSGEKVQPIFISVDPRRDTPDRLDAYAKDYHPRTVWLTGSNEQISAVAKAFRVYYSPPPEDEEDYQVDHSIFFYLMDKDFQFLEFFGKNMSAEEVAHKMAKVIKADKAQPQQS